MDDGGSNSYPYKAYDINSVRFVVDRRYHISRAIGKGAYGYVRTYTQHDDYSCICAARDQLTGREVAVKKVANAFDRKSQAIRMLREIRLLKHLNVRPMLYTLLL